MPVTVGQSVPRIDGREKVTGRALYASDLTFPNLAHGKILRSPYAHAKIVRIDARRAEAMPGVVAVLTRENLMVRAPYFGTYIKDQPIVALDKVRYAGDIVAAVAATDERTAEQALGEIEVDYEELPALFDLDAALAAGAPMIHDENPARKDPRYGYGASVVRHDATNIFYHFRYERGDIERGLKECDRVFTETYYLAGAQHYPLESHACVADDRGDEITVWSGTQTPFPLRQEIARMFGLPQSRVRVIVPYLGGGYGAKSGVKTEALAVALSRLAQRPVRVHLSAEETFKTLADPAAKVTITTGVKNDGGFVARRCEVYFNGGAYANSGPTVTERAGYRAHGPYKIPHVRTDAYCVYTNIIPGGAFRGFGGPQVSFAYESQADTIARALKIDPVELRLKNLLDKGEPYTAGNIPIDCDLKSELKSVARTIGWREKSVTETMPGIRRGKGIACAVKDGGGVNKEANAIVQILIDGSALLFLGSVEMGQGVRTALMQVVAEELSLAPEKIQVAPLDSAYTPFDRGTHASSAITVMGQAVQAAARDAREKLLALAADLFEAPAAELRMKDGLVTFGGKQAAFGEIMRRHFGDLEGEITGRGRFKVERRDDAPLGYPATFWENGLAAAEVEVDEKTGTVKLLNYVSLTDAGKMINPPHCRGQEEGSVLFGIGHALHEELVYRDGGLANPNLLDYHLPRFRDVPAKFHSIIVEESGGTGPFGAKGIGEGGTLAAAAAICNAVYDATGVRVYQVPLTSERVWTALENSAGKRGV
ncbi:MAG TPA: xanthine dehydrogenase family protein molybdopterin-binding subunit [Verrucomicrobiae bacterium]|jgi:CO/xanthine dehydrogenase Mo-binding subunit|nr:xanthine dehydrogenase family protein molybdopterin-binding subunit [Verrucomicrobiae bacterium]